MKKFFDTLFWFKWWAKMLVREKNEFAINIKNLGFESF